MATATRQFTRWHSKPGCVQAPSAINSLMVITTPELHVVDVVRAYERAEMRISAGGNPIGNLPEPWAREFVTLQMRVR